MPITELTLLGISAVLLGLLCIISLAGLITLRRIWNGLDHRWTTEEPPQQEVVAAQPTDAQEAQKNLDLERQRQHEDQKLTAMISAVLAEELHTDIANVKIVNLDQISE